MKRTDGREKTETIADNRDAHFFKDSMIQLQERRTTDVVRKKQTRMLTQVVGPQPVAYIVQAP